MGIHAEAKAPVASQLAQQLVQRVRNGAPLQELHMALEELEAVEHSVGWVKPLLRNCRGYGQLVISHGEHASTTPWSLGGCYRGPAASGWQSACNSVIVMISGGWKWMVIVVHCG